MMKLATTRVFAGTMMLSFLGLSLVACNPAGNEVVGGQGGTTGNGGPIGDGGTTGKTVGSGGSDAGFVLKLDGNGMSAGGTAGSSTTYLAPTADANCGAQTATTERVPADVLLVFDRSGSMTLDITGECICDPDWIWFSGDGCGNMSTCTARWDGLSSAVTETLATATNIRWGLKLYPSSSGDACSVSSGIEVPVGPDSTTIIKNVISSTTPDGNTPTAVAIRTAATYLQGVNDQSNKVILLATDGEPNCRGGGIYGDEADEAGTISAITAAKNAGVPVYVIGIGPSVGNLDDFARAGGTEKYYPATSTQELGAALASISKAVVTCTFGLKSVPPDINNLAVYLDKSLVPKSDTDGWSLGADEQSIVLGGSYCDKISSGEASTVQVLFGCPGSAPPDFIP